MTTGQNPIPTRRLALLVGNTHYTDPNLHMLVSPQADLHDLADTLEAAALGAFDHVQVLLNPQVQQVRTAIADLFGDNRRREDLLLLYFSGHGIRNFSGDLYLAVADTDTRAHRLTATAIPAAYVSEQMDNSNSRRMVIILDCCHSGAFARGTKAVAAQDVDVQRAFAGIGSGRVILTATDSTQFAWEGGQIVGEPPKPSLFTRYMIEGIRTGAADRERKGHVTVDDLYEYTHAKVTEVTPRQRPRKYVLDQDGAALVIARVVSRGQHDADSLIGLQAELMGLRAELVSFRRLQGTMLAFEEFLLFQLSMRYERRTESARRTVAERREACLRELLGACAHTILPGVDPVDRRLSVLQRTTDGLLGVVASHNIDAHARERVRTLGRDRGLANWAIREMRVGYCQDINDAQDPMARVYEHKETQSGYASVVCVPIVLPEPQRAIGVISAAGPTAKAFTDVDLYMLETFARKAAIVYSALSDRRMAGYDTRAPQDTSVEPAP